MGLAAPDRIMQITDEIVQDLIKIILDRQRFNCRKWFKAIRYKEKPVPPE